MMSRNSLKDIVATC